MRRFVLVSSSKISACAIGWKTRVYVNTTSTSTVPYSRQNSLLPKNSTQWLDSLRQNELGARLFGSLTTARRKFWVKKDFQSSRRTAAQLNIRLAVGSFHLIEKLSPSEMGRA